MCVQHHFDVVSFAVEGVSDPIGPRNLYPSFVIVAENTACLGRLAFLLRYVEPGRDVVDAYAPNRVAEPQTAKRLHNERDRRLLFTGRARVFQVEDDLVGVRRTESERGVARSWKKTEAKANP